MKNKVSSRKKTVRRSSSLLGAVVLVVFVVLAASVVLVSNEIQKGNFFPKDPHAAVFTGLPPIPAGIPANFSFGLFHKSAMTDIHANVPYDYRYQYLSGGVNTGNGWATWNTNGAYASGYIEDSYNHVPRLQAAFEYYQIIQSAPNYDEYNNLNNTSTMNAYYNDFKLLMDKINASHEPNTLVMIEADLTGDMQQETENRTGTDDATRLSTSVASSGNQYVQGYPNTFSGFYQALAHIRDVYAPQAVLTIDVSPFGADSTDVTIALRDNPSYDWQTHATKTAAFLSSLDPNNKYQLLSYSPLDRDAQYYQITQNSNRWWWDDDSREPKFSTMRSWLATIISQTNKRMMMWQVPNGNRLYRTENNTNGHYQDNRPEYFLNPTNGRTHLQDWANIGVVGILWGAGVGSQTHYYDADADGITNPAQLTTPGNPMGIVNSQTSTYADDDGGYIRLGMTSYYQNPLPLPGTNVTPGPTATPTVGPSPTPTRVPTPTLVPDTQPPTVSLTSPLNGSTYARKVGVPMQATATDNVGVTKVVFYVNNVVKNTDTTSPYAYTWTSNQRGTYSLKARAYDAAGNWTDSNVVSVTIQ